MSKYEPLQRHLERLSQAHLPMRFEEIEAILGFELPDSAHRHRAWWSNNPSNNVMTRAWLAAGFETEAVDIDQRHLVFRRTRGGRGAVAAPSGAPELPARARASKHPAFGAMKGMVTFTFDFDPTAPADPDWDGIAGGGA